MNTLAQIPPVLAQAIFGLSFVQFAIAIVLFIAVCALVALYMRMSGIAPPPWFIQALWIVLGAVVIIFAILFIARVAGWA